MIATSEIVNRCRLALQIADCLHAFITKHLVAAPMHSCQHYYPRCIDAVELQLRGIPHRDIRLSLRESIEAFPRTKWDVLPLSESLETEEIFGKILWCEANEGRMG